MSKIKIPPVLRDATGGKSEVEVAGENIEGVLRALAEKHPETKSQIFSTDGELNRYVNIYLNDEDVRMLSGVETEVGDEDTVVILPAMAGGSQYI